MIHALPAGIWQFRTWGRVVRRAAAARCPTSSAGSGPLPAWGHACCPRVSLPSESYTAALEEKRKRSAAWNKSQLEGGTASMEGLARRGQAAAGWGRSCGAAVASIVQAVFFNKCEMLLVPALPAHPPELVRHRGPRLHRPDRCMRKIGFKVLKKASSCKVGDETVRGCALAASITWAQRWRRRPLPAPTTHTAPSFLAKVLCTTQMNQDHI